VSLLLVELIDRQGERLQAEVAVRRDTVEIRFAESLVGIADRDLLRAWLRHPEGSYVYDDVTWFTFDGRVGLEIRELSPAAVLADGVLNSLRERI
jgi:hypothetical protein